MLDRTRKVRPGEELDVERLCAFLAEKVPGLAGLTPAHVVVEQFPGGHSNLTYLVRLGAPFARDLVLRRPPFGNQVKTAHDMGREVRVLTKLAPVYAPAPRVVASTEDEGVLGAPFYLMEPVEGLIFRRTPPAGVIIDAALARTLSETTVDGLAELHAVDVAKHGLLDLGKPEGFVRRQVTGWAERYEKAKTDDVPDVPWVVSWLMDHQPASPPPTIVHNDWKLDNLVLDPNDPRRIVGVLDWEMATVGDPLMDVGTMLSYWVEKGDPDEFQMMAFGPTNVDGSLTRREAAARYASKTGRDLSGIVFYYAFACFKTAVVAQQIYARYKKGLTKDERFAMMIFGVRALGAAARRGIESGTV
ncbi:MAG TPA: phosphotransferase family protein [Polyangiaceae bacterium]